MTPHSLELKLRANAEQIRTKVLSLKSAKDVADMLEVPYQVLVWHLYRYRSATRYRTKLLKKRSGGTRELRIPNPGLAILQAKLLECLILVFEPKVCVQGFVRGRSIKSHADLHCGRKWVLKVDLADYFGTINFGRVRGMFMSGPIGARQEAATVLAQLCCWENQLPQGAPTSPVVSNLVTRSLDLAMRRVAKRFGCFYSRYADDLTFSTNRTEFPSQLATLYREDGQWRTKIGDALATEIHAAGFSINDKKSRLMRFDTRQVVTGLVVNKTANVHRWRIDRIRAQLHAWEKFEVKSAASEWLRRHNLKGNAADFRAHVGGSISFVSMIRGSEDLLVQRLWSRYSALSDRSVGRRAIWIVETFDTEKQGTCFLLDGIGFVTAQHVIEKSEIFSLVDPENSQVRYSAKLRLSNRDADVCVLDCPSIPSNRLKSLARAEKPAKLGEHVKMRGYPNHNERFTVFTTRGEVVQEKSVMGSPNLLVSFQILSGASGSPVLNQSKQVVGVAVAGADFAGHGEHAESRVSVISNLDLAREVHSL
jgi:RNA-directed DNA polymerase